MTIKIMVTEMKGRFAVYFTAAANLEQAREDVAGTGSTETVHQLIKFTPQNFDEKPTHELIRALSRLQTESPESAGQILERMLTRMFVAGLEHGKKLKS